MDHTFTERIMAKALTLSWWCNDSIPNILFGDEGLTPSQGISFRWCKEESTLAMANLDSNSSIKNGSYSRESRGMGFESLF